MMDFQFYTYPEVIKMNDNVFKFCSDYINDKQGLLELEKLDQISKKIGNIFG